MIVDDCSIPHFPPSSSLASPPPPAPCLASRLMLHSGVGASWLPVKTVRAVGATKDLGFKRVGHARWQRNVGVVRFLYRYTCIDIYLLSIFIYMYICMYV